MKINYTYMDLFTIEYYRNDKLACIDRSGKMLEAVAEQAYKIALANGFQRTVYVMTGCTISCHGGKGAIGLAGVTE